MTQTSDKLLETGEPEREKASLLHRPWQFVAPVSRNWLLCLIIGGVALGFNLYRLGNPSLWFDEVLSVERARQPLPVLWHIVFSTQQNMALYYLLLHLWLGFTTFLGLHATEFVVRLPTAVFAAFGSMMVFLLGRRFMGILGSTVGAVLYLLNTLQFVYAQETRSYALQLLLICIAWYGLFAALGLGTTPGSPGKAVQDRQATEKPYGGHAAWRYRWWACYIAAMTLAIYAHLFSILILLAQVVTIGVLLVLGGLKRDRTLRSLLSSLLKPQTARQLLPAIVSWACIGTLIIPMLLAARHGSKTGWLPTPHPGDILLLFLTIADNSTAYLLAIAACCITGVSAAILVRIRGQQGGQERPHETGIGINRRDSSSPSVGAGVGMMRGGGLYGRPPSPDGLPLSDSVTRTPRATIKSLHTIPRMASPAPPNHPRPYGILGWPLRLMRVGRPHETGRRQWAGRPQGSARIPLCTSAFRAGTRLMPLALRAHLLREEDSAAAPSLRLSRAERQPLHDLFLNESGDGKRLLQLQQLWPIVFALLCWIVIPIVLSYIISQGPTRLFSSRYLVTIMPPMFLLVGVGVTVLRWRAVQIALALSLLLITLHHVPQYYNNAQVEDWRTPSLWLEQHYQAGDGLVCYNNAQGCQVSIEYYLYAYPNDAHFTADSPGSFPWVNYDLTNHLGNFGAAVDLAALAAYGAKHPRLFFIAGRFANNAEAALAQAAQHWLDSHYHLIAQSTKGAVTIRLYATKAGT